MKTAVDSIIAKLNNVKPIEFCSIETIKEWCEQAKEIEKQQIKNAYWDGKQDYFCSDIDDEIYYQIHYNKKD
jgi:hypothetical protein